MTIKTGIALYKEELATATRLKAEGKTHLYNTGDAFHPESFIPLPIDEYIARWSAAIEQGEKWEIEQGEKNA